MAPFIRDERLHELYEDLGKDGFLNIDMYDSEDVPPCARYCGVRTGDTPKAQMMRAMIEANPEISVDEYVELLKKMEREYALSVGDHRYHQPAM